MTKKKDMLHFRVHTPNLLQEITDCTLANGKNGIFFVPINTLRMLLVEVAGRCSKLNDPVLNRLMFDLNLYELPNPKDGTGEYSKIMKRLYREEKEHLKNNPS